LVQNTLVDEITVKRGLTPEQTSITATNLARVLLRSKKSILDDLSSPRFSPYEPVVVAKQVDFDSLVYIEEHPELFPGVQATRRTTRLYPNGDTAGHLIGYVAAINREELKIHKGEGYGQSDQIGKQGVEQLFESELRGVPRTRRLEVDSRGRFVQVLSDTPAQAGHDVQLTLDLGVQKIAEESLAQGMLGARRLHSTSGGSLKADAGAVVVLNANDGSIVAMASAPAEPVDKFTNGIQADEFKALTDPSAHYPLINRAIQGLYAPGSTFKLFTSIAALEDGVITPDFTFNDRGFVTWGGSSNKITLFNAQHEAHGIVDLKRALTVSSDVFFYNVGFKYFQDYGSDYQSTDLTKKLYGIQRVARTFGFGSATGVGLPDEAKGRVPDLSFKLALNKGNPDGSTQVWLPGDGANLAVGQGDLVVTPLQLATAYAAFANGGILYQPRVASKILENSGIAGPGKVVRDLPSQPTAKIKIPDDVRNTILPGLAGAVCDPEGTAYAAFQGYPCNVVAGKTGTAQTGGSNQQDNALFCGFTPVDPPPADSGQPQYVVCVVVEHGGFGGSVAAPIARRIFDYLLGDTSPAPVRVAAPAPKND
ncbi:MAG TPA: penicillin-binding transpeptidase domain-containing protein, partial [Acidimicrobiia bacterium]|nr:penicillin-binding transpeptidase domain-containing protein [Acidimicrobiia bacterium]